jgi:hypothetical protein
LACVVGAPQTDARREHAADVRMRGNGEAMKHIAIGAVLLTMAVCGGAAAEDYHPARAPGGQGYFSEPGDNGRWVVGYTGDAGQAPQEIAQFALRRAAELALEQNQEWFALLGSASQIVEIGVADELVVRAGHFMGVGPDRKTFGGELAPSNVLERWRPRQALQTVLVIQLGSGDTASFPGVEQTPKIFPAAGAASE